MKWHKYRKERQHEEDNSNDGSKSDDHEPGARRMRDDRRGDIGSNRRGRDRSGDAGAD